MPIPYSIEEDCKIISFYKSNHGKPICLNELSNILGRSRWSVAMRASRLGVCEPSRPMTESHRSKCAEANRRRAKNLTPEQLRNISEKLKEWHSKNEHPKGMLGKKHRQKSKDAMSLKKKNIPVPFERTVRQMKTRLEKYGTLSPVRKGTTWKSGWRTIGGQKKYFRSRWEANYARYLEFQKQHGLIKSWEHECEIFWFNGIKRGCVSYLPDFKVTNTNGSIEYHEVKGWMDAASKTKIKRMAKYFPEIKLRILDANWYRSNSRKLSGLIKDWE